MKSKAYIRFTDYQDYVCTKLGYTMYYMNTYFTMQEFADACGVKPTHNFRRLMNRLVDDGLYERFFKHNEKGRIAALFARKGSLAPDTPSAGAIDLKPPRYYR